VPKILVADDNSNIQKMVSLAFEEHGIDVVAVGNGEAAVRRIPDVNPDLVLADIFMPVRNGYEVCEFVKKDPRFAKVPVILLVGAFDPLDENEARRVGADGVLKKPFVPPDPLIAMVTSALGKLPKPAPEPKPEPVVVAAVATPAPPPVVVVEPEPEPDEEVYAFGTGRRDLLDEEEEAPAPAAAKGSAPKSKPAEEEEEDEDDGATTAHDWRRNAMDFEVPEGAGAAAFESAIAEADAEASSAPAVVSPRLDAHVRFQPSIEAPVEPPTIEVPAQEVASVEAEPLTESAAPHPNVVSAPEPVDVEPPALIEPAPPVDSKPAAAASEPLQVESVKTESEKLAGKPTPEQSTAIDPGIHSEILAKAASWAKLLLPRRREPAQESPKPPEPTQPLASVEVKPEAPDVVAPQPITPQEVPTESMQKEESAPASPLEIVAQPRSAEVAEALSLIEEAPPVAEPPLAAVSSMQPEESFFAQPDESNAGVVGGMSSHSDFDDRPSDARTDAFFAPSERVATAPVEEPFPASIDAPPPGAPPEPALAESSTAVANTSSTEEVPAEFASTHSGPAAPHLEPPLSPEETSAPVTESMPHPPADSPFAQEVKAMVQAEASPAKLDQASMDAVVNRVLDKLQPRLNEILSDGVLRPLIENVLKKELEKQ
jgi:CheY-like chemotaxis protein